MTKTNFNDHCRPLFSKLNILTVPNLYIFETVKSIIKELPNLSLRSDVHNNNTRNSNSIDYNFCRLSKSMKSHSVIGLRIYNKIKKRLDSYPISLGLKRLRVWLNNNPFYKLDEFLTMNENSILF